MVQSRELKMHRWSVWLSRAAIKQYEKLKLSGSKKPSIIDAIDLLVIELRSNGPHLSTWPHYAPLGQERYHCHLRKGRPTYVACWQVLDKQAKQIEVYYVGSHEGAPY